MRVRGESNKAGCVLALLTAAVRQDQQAGPHVVHHMWLSKAAHDLSGLLQGVLGEARGRPLR
jgi:hypothetical protein